MARNPGIKPEPGLTAPGTSLGRPPSVFASADRHLTSQSSRARAQPSTLGSPTEPYQPSERRMMRSAAPSIDTPRPPYHSVSGGETNTAGDGTEDCLLMEMRPRVKDQISIVADESMSRNTSFVLNGLPFQNLGEKLKPINDTLGKLQSLGIQHVTSLPELVLVGDQSSGKSSVMSALAGLNLPRSAGMCTKCPIHIRLSSAREWSCVVSLHEDYAYVPGDDDNISEKDVTADNPYPPWKKQPHRVVKNLKTIKEDSHDTKDIEHVLRWAQVAILNHGYDHTQYIPALYGEPGYVESDGRALTRLVEHEASTRAKFSPNTVALEISGPGLADMSFYDLPGVVAAAANNHHAYLEKVLENLVREYISHPGAIILWAVPMNADAETSQTFKLIRQGIAQERCVTVMTKADLLPTGGHAQWIKMLRGESHKTDLGYFITSRREFEFANSTSLESWEESFFNRRANNGSHSGQLIPEWPREFSKFDDVCGVSKLKVYLSQKLGEEFAKSLPQVKKKIETKLREVEQQLTKLPDLPANAELEIRKSLIEFATTVKDCLNGKDFAALWAPAADIFKRSIIGMKPKFIVKSEGRYSVDANGVINLADSDSVMSGNGSPQKHRISIEDHIGAQAKRAKLEDGWVPAPGRNPFWSPASIRCQSKTLSEIRDLLQSKRSAGKPSIIPPDVYEQLCMEAIQPWEGQLKPLVDHTCRLLTEEIKKTLNKAFSKLKKRMIFKESEKYIKDYLDDHKAALIHRLAHVHKLESRQLYTLDHESFSRHQEDERRTLARVRHHYRWVAYSGDSERILPKPWAELSQEEKSQEAVRMQKEASKLGKDPFEAELDVAAYVRGYYLTAASRFVDNTSLHITSGLFPEMAEQISLYLDGKLGLLKSPVDPKAFENLMEEDKHTINRRDHLKAELTKFREAMKSIQELELPQHRNGRSDSDATFVVDDADIRTPDEDDDVEVDGDGRFVRV